ncbi:hypothetical protein EI42_04615 [Thermosporothrix hazakensis]|jgi:hypothetical protein|uniref:Helix-turn-helix protein n=1 Tax=Thermosporothrix hazakensis TaxID=644383 RepID=A0A326U1K2_THEHA|nr:DNA-binding protein [Thermosporothrix hazakensis]PZW24733.1 hypothetical protein EI42_04615 [Thermosporothrix hazakensis]GCE48321.1 hypothetical protein KTH_31900 [Thermosporothrix hazakensis]
MNKGQIITAKRAADLLGMSPQWVRKLALDGKIPSYVPDEEHGGFKPRGQEKKRLFFYENDIKCKAEEIERQKSQVLDNLKKKNLHITNEERQLIIKTGNELMQKYGYVSRTTLHKILLQEQPDIPNSKSFYRKIRQIAHEMQWPIPPRARNKNQLHRW